MVTAQNQPQNKTALSLADTSVLMVDADRYSTEMLSGIMRAFGLKNLAIVETGEEAKGSLLGAKSDLVIVEAVLPDMRGADLVKWMRRSTDPVIQHATIIILTGHTILANVESARNSGANIVVKKPVSPSILFDRISWAAKNDRLFIETSTYVGPDRRFRFLGPPDGIGRRSTDLPVEIGDASEPNLQQCEIDSFIKPVRISLE